ncbi:MAG: formimidoylglutamate deiminase [Steroidobacteraceae bacterium]
MQSITAKRALLPDGWHGAVAIDVDANGRIAAIRAAPVAEACEHDLLLPAPANVHSHAFQRAMAGLAEARGTAGGDNFWSWRQRMYQLVERLTPQDLHAITALAQMEMLEAGFASVAEFHYLHRDPNGANYADVAEMASAVVAASRRSGIGLTLLPVLYQRGGCDGRALEGAQRRFGNTLHEYQRLLEACQALCAHALADFRVGAAAHSLRAVEASAMIELSQLPSAQLLHIHAAEQRSEVEEVNACLGARPVEWLLRHCGVDARWTIVHATHLLAGELKALARSGAVAALCPVTEANLGDGIFPAGEFAGENGLWGVGSDSNVEISVAAELRMLEYSQRLRDQERTRLAATGGSSGRFLIEQAVRGGARALGRGGGGIALGEYADLMTLDSHDHRYAARRDDQWLDTWIFADGGVSEVWAAGRHLVHQGRHVERTAIIADYRRCLERLRTW